MPDQLSLDFDASASQRHRRASQRRAKAQLELDRPKLFQDDPVNIDIHLLDAQNAVAELAGGNPEASRLWLERIVGPTVATRRRRVSFPAQRLPLLAWVRPPARVSLDAACQAVVRALWAHALGLKPLQVERRGQRIVASSPPSWPKALALADVPWSAITTLTSLGVPLAVDDKARILMLDKLAKAHVPIARGGLAGSAVRLVTDRPELVESLGLPALSYSGPAGTGDYHVPLLSAESLLRTPQVELSSEVEKAITAAARKPRPLAPIEGFPWTLYEFQSRDVARAIRILEVTGGVLLAAEMGAGKTTMSLAVAEQLELWPLLVVAPLSAFSTWQRQLGEMGKKTILATGNQEATWNAITTESFDALVVSFDRLSAFAEAIEHRGFRGIIADEIQRIRTAGSRRSRVLRQLAASVPYRIGLSGTPLTNTVNDLLPIGSFLVPGEWRPRASSKDLSDMYPGDPVEAIAEHLGAMMVRRRMTEVGARLPKRHTHRVTIELEPEQRRALAELQAEALAAKSEGAFDSHDGRMHAFARLTRMRQAINAPSTLSLGCPNPKVRAAVDLAGDFISRGRKGVIFCADRTTFRELGEALDKEGIGWVGIWGATPPLERIAAEKRFHNDDDVKVVLCTIQAGSESWSASPTATWLISTSYMYAPATLAQMEARVYRMNSDPDGPDVEIFYIHAHVPGGGLDDRMVEILEAKKQLFAQVVDRSVHVDDTKVHYSLADLMFLLTGEHDEALAAREADKVRTREAEQQAKRHARATAHRRKGKNKNDGDLVIDSGESTLTLEEWQQWEAEDTLEDSREDLSNEPDAD